MTFSANFLDADACLNVVRKGIGARVTVTRLADIARLQEVGAELEIAILRTLKGEDL